MRDDPSGAALLEVAHDTLMGEIAPDLTGRSRYLALMIASAIRMVAREIAGAALVDAVGRRLARSLARAAEAQEPAAEVSRAIRAGTVDADARLYAALRELTLVAVSISKPGFLSSPEREAVAIANDAAPAAPRSGR